MTKLRNVGLRAAEKFLALFVFLTIVLAGGGGMYALHHYVLAREQTVFPGGVPPDGFKVLIENREAASAAEKFIVVTWMPVTRRWVGVPEILARNPDALRLSVKKLSGYADGDPFHVRVIEETAGSQTIELGSNNTHQTDTKYRVEGSNITPLSYRVWGSFDLMVLIPIGVFVIWLGNVAAKRSARWVRPATG